ncbi:hypothetical protein [Lysinibacillus agricola]|uniref:hypothetical protein n=1 Tax=Lysinibacillus agricola TaxID=2590012 RepID=UPI003C301DEE
MKIEQNRVKRLFDENAVTQSAAWLDDVKEKKKPQRLQTLQLIDSCPLMCRDSIQL